MRGAHKGPFDDPEGEIGAGAPSRRLTPSIGLAPDDDAPPEVANEDFLFHLYRGSELLQDNRAHEAKEELERALNLQPHDTKGQDLLAVVYFRLGLYPRAIAIYEQLRRTSPRDPALLLNLALCYLKTGQPSLARRDLEQLLVLNPTHTRAWGYLGLACERTGDLKHAQRAFEKGGHAQMARRMAERRASQSPPGPLPAESNPSRELREVVAAAYEELDAGELSFELAQPASDSRDEQPGSWRPVELGQVHATDDEAASAKPDTKDGPPPPRAPAIPQVRHPGTGGGHRPTLIVGVPPAADPADIEALALVTGQKHVALEMDGSGAPSRRPVVAVPPVRQAVEGMTGVPYVPPSLGPGKQTLAPPPVRAPSAPPPPAAQLTRDSIVEFPAPGAVSIHPSGVALVRTAPIGFAARLEAVRASSNGLAMKLLERQVKGKATGESFGGVGSPIVHVTGEGQLVLAARTGRKLSSFTLEDDLCFVREEVLLGFDGEVAFENGRLATGEGEFVSVVQLKGTGAVLLEGIGEVLTLEVQGSRGLTVRREVILGWFGRLVPRALATSEAPCGQRGLVSFAGEGRVLVASA